MRKATAGLLAVLATAAFAGQAEAQIPNLTPLAVEIHGGGAFPTGDLKDLGGASTGYTFGADVTAHLLPIGGIYAGYSYSQFGSDQTLNGEDVEYVVDGFSVGARVGIPTPLIPIDPWIKAGAVFYDVDTQVGGQSLGVEADTSIGFEVGAGLGVNILPKVQLVPQVNYTRFSLEDEDDEDDNVTFVRAEVGVRIRI